jgi:hypothetical protein
MLYCRVLSIDFSYGVWKEILTISYIELNGRNKCEKLLQDGKICYHFENVFPCVSSVSYMDQIRNDRHRNFLILACQKHGNKTNQLKFLSHYILLSQESVYEINCKKQCLLHEVEFVMNLISIKQVYQYLSRLLNDKEINNWKEHLFSTSISQSTSIALILSLRSSCSSM